MVVLSGTKSDKVLKQCHELWQECFEDSEEYLSCYETNVMTENTVYLDYEGEELAAMVHANPVRVVLRGKVQSMTYLVAVSTRAKYRHQGRMRRLMEAAIHDAMVRGEAGIFLMPARKGLYERFGFKEAYVTKEFIVTALNEPNTANTDVLVPNVEGLGAWVHDFLCSRDVELFSLRDAAYYNRALSLLHADDGEILSLRDKENRIMGSITIYRTTKEDGTKGCEIEECIVAPENRERMWQALQSLLSVDGTSNLTFQVRESVWLTDEWLTEQMERQVILYKTLNQDTFPRSCYINEMQ